MSNKHFTLPYEGGLIEKNLPQGILHNYEKIWTEIYPISALTFSNPFNRK